MKSPTAILKLAFILAATFILGFADQPQRWFILAGMLCLFAALILLPLYSQNSIKIYLPAHPLTLVTLPLLFFLVQARLASDEPPVEPPEIWYLHENSEDPDYNRRILASAEIRNMISPGLYLLEVEITDVEEIAFFRRGSRWIRYWRSNPALIQRHAGIPETSFPVLAHINDRSLQDGCSLDLQVYGRGVPRRLAKDSEGYDSYLVSHGGFSHIRLSTRYHILDIDCERIGMRSRVRRNIQDIIEQSGLEDRSENAVKGILFGQSGWMDRTFRDMAVELGILHIFAASGLHLGIFFSCFYFPLAKLFGKKSLIALWMPLVPCFFYLWLLDFPVSLTRAFSFISFFALQAVIHRKMFVIDQLSNAAIVLLLFNPDGFVSISGALSFGAVSGILYFYKPIFEHCLKVKNFLLRFISAQWAISFAASVFTSPAILVFFGAYSYSSPLANLFIVPLISVLLPLVYLAIFISYIPFPEVLAEFLSQIWIIVIFGMDFFVGLTEKFSDFSMFYRFESLYSFPVMLSLAVIAALIMLYRRIEKQGYSLRWSRIVLVLLLLTGPPGYFLTWLILEFISLPEILTFFGGLHD